MASGEEEAERAQPIQVATKPVFIILGKPGSGKTTLAAKLASKLNAELVSPTHALENVLQEETDLSKEVSELARQGKDVPTTLVVRAMENRLRAEETSFRGYVLEGVPSNLPSTGSSISQDLQLLTRCATNSAKNHTPVLIDLRIDDANLTLRRQHQYLDPVTGVIYNGAHVEFSRKPPIEPEADLIDSAIDAGSVRDVGALDIGASVASLGDVEGYEEVEDLVWDAAVDDEEVEEEKLGGDEEDSEETEQDVERKKRSALRKRRAATRKAIFSGKSLWTRIDVEILQRLIHRPEDNPKAVQSALEEYNNHAPFLRTLVGTHFGALSKIVVDATQNADAVFLDVLQQIDQKEILLNKRNSSPKRIGGPEQAAGFKNLPADDIIKYLCEADLEPGLPRRELTLWGNFCPVSYFNGSSLVPGQFTYPVSYKGKLYLLATEPNFSAFLLNPDKYLAQPPHLNSLKMCIMGGPFSGKSTQAQKLAEAYRLKLVDVDAFLTKWDRDPDQQELQKKSSVYAKIIRKCKSGKIITGDLLVDVIKLILKENAQDYNGWVLDGFPRTMEQAQQLVGAGIIPTYAVVFQNDINEQTVRDRGTVFKVDSATGYRPETSSPENSQNRNDSIQTIAEFPFFDNLFNGFKEEYTEIVRVLEDVDVQVLPVPAEYQRMTITSMIQTAVDPFFQKARAVQSTKMLDGIFEFGKTADYCPYTRKIRNILCKGSKQFTATYKSRIYYCASEEARTSFITEPHNYITQESGEPLKIPPVRLMFIGPLGAGKSSAIFQPQIAKFGIPHVSFDEYLEAFRIKQPESVAAEIDYMIQENAGILSPPIVSEIISTLFTEEPYASKGFILEGFPRSKMEGDVILKQGYHVDAFVNFKIDAVVVARRLQDMRDKSRSLEEIQDGEDDSFEDYLDVCDKELSKIGDVITTIETTSQIPLIEVEASRCTRAVVGVLVKRLQQFFEDRSSLLCKPVPLDLNSAQAILENEAKRNSKFGKYCPVEHYTNKALTSKLYGRLPVLWDGEVYFLRNEKNKQMFMSNVLRYLDQPAPLPVSRPSICIVGRPKAGKTYLGQTMAEDFNMEYLTVSKAVQTILGSQEELVIRQQLLDALGKGSELSDEICNRALHLIISRASCQSKGWVLDGYPLTVRQCELFRESGLMPQKVANVNLAENLIDDRSRDDWNAASSLNIASLDIPEIVRLRDLKSREQLEKITKFLHTHYTVLHPLDGSMSKWHLRSELRQSVMANIAKRQLFIALTTKGRAASMAGMGIGLETLQQKTSELGRYCPVRLVDYEELVIGPLSTDFVAVYKDTYYWLAGRDELERFLNDEARYTVGRQLPSPLPKQISANQFKELFPKPLEMQGYCVVTFVQGFEKGDGHVPLSSIVPGDHAFLAEYDGKVFATASAEQLDKFMRTPWKYVGYRLPKKLPPLHAPLNVAALPMVGYLEQSVAICLNSALSAVGKFRPKFPYQSLENSGLHYVALHMKAHNPKSSDFIRKEYTRRLDRYQKQCQLIESLSKYAKSAQYVAPELREPNFDKDMEIFLSLNPGKNTSEKNV